MVDLETLHQRGHIINQHGKQFVLYSGLLWLAHENGLKSIDTTLTHADYGKGLFVFKAVASGARGTYSGHGDASPKNISSPAVQKAALRMAETRATARALRNYLGLGMTAWEELPGDDKPEQNGSRAREQSRPGQPAPVEGFRKSIEEMGVKWADLCALAKTNGWDHLSEWSHTGLKALYNDLRAGAFPDLYQPEQAGGEG